MQIITVAAALEKRLGAGVVHAVFDTESPAGVAAAVNASKSADLAVGNSRLPHAHRSSANRLPLVHGCDPIAVVPPHCGGAPLPPPPLPPHTHKYLPLVCFEVQYGRK